MPVAHVQIETKATNSTRSLGPVQSLPRPCLGAGGKAQLELYLTGLYLTGAVPGALNATLILNRVSMGAADRPLLQV